MLFMKYWTILLAVCLEGAIGCEDSVNESLVIAAKTSLAKVMFPSDGSKSRVVASTDLRNRSLVSGNHSDAKKNLSREKEEKKGFGATAHTGFQNLIPMSLHLKSPDFEQPCGEWQHE